MSDIVKALGHIVSPVEIAAYSDRIHAITGEKEMRLLLQSRHMYRVINLRGKNQDSTLRQINLLRKKHYDGVLGAFALSNVQGDAIGMIIADPEAVLRRQRLPVAPIFARGKLAYNVPVTGPKIKGWTAPVKEGGRVLARGYLELSMRDGPAADMYERFKELHNITDIKDVKAWTIEPMDAPPWIHKAITAAGFAERRTGIYDDYEPQQLVPPAAILYQSNLNTSP
jgi:hypothetical protein